MNLNELLRTAPMAQGYFHLVFPHPERPNDAVVKVQRNIDPKLQSRYVEDFSLTANYFPKYNLPAEVIPSEHHEIPFVVVQERLNGCKPLTLDDLKDPEIFTQVKEIFDMNQSLLKDKARSFDPLGLEGSLISFRYLAKDSYFFKVLSILGDTYCYFTAPDLLKTVNKFTGSSPILTNILVDPAKHLKIIDLNLLDCSGKNIVESVAYYFSRFIMGKVFKIKL